MKHKLKKEVQLKPGTRRVSDRPGKSILLALMVLMVPCLLYAGPGDTLWTRTYGGDNDREGSCVQQTTDGGYIIAGSETTGAYPLTYNLILVKTDDDGDTAWTRTYGGDVSWSGSSVQQTADNGYIITGFEEISGYPPSNIALVMKTDENGDTSWTHLCCEGKGKSVQQTTDGGYIIVGSKEQGSYVITSDALLIKTDGNGDTAWTRIYGEEGSNYFGNSGRQTADGGYIIAGSKQQGDYMITSEALLIKTDGNGDAEWTLIHGEEGSNYFGQSVQQTTDGGYIIAGYKEQGDYVITSEALLIKTDGDGDILWTQTYGVENYMAYSVQPTLYGGYILAGFSLSGYSDGEVLLLETDADGNALWTRTYDCGWRANCVRHTDDGNYIVTGYESASDDPVLLMKIEGGEFISGYAYLPGDVNMALGVWPPTVIGGDVTYLVGYFIGGGQESCLLDDFWCSADINGDCVIIGGDVTALVGYFVAGGDLVPCPDYESLWPPLPPEAPAGWPNCDTPVINSKIIPTGSIE